MSSFIFEDLERRVSKLENIMHSFADDIAWASNVSNGFIKLKTLDDVVKYLKVTMPKDAYKTCLGYIANVRDKRNPAREIALRISRHMGAGDKLPSYDVYDIISSTSYSDIKDAFLQ